MSDFYEEACYLSNGEAEADDSEAEEFAPMGSHAEAPAARSGELAWDDPAAMLDAWLGELDSLQMVSTASIVDIHQGALQALQSGARRLRLHRALCAVRPVASCVSARNPLGG